MANWWVNTQPGPTFPGGTAWGGGGSIGSVQYRSPLDAARAAQGQIPQSMYPDGYLGTIVDRREDRLLEKIQEKLTERSYQRGVHKGAKIDASDYFWNDKAIQPDMRLRAQAKSQLVDSEGGLVYISDRFAQAGDPVERLAHMGKTAGLSAPEQMDVYRRFGVSMAKNPVVNVDPDSVARKQKMLPTWARSHA